MSSIGFSIRFHALAVVLLGVLTAAPTCGGASDTEALRGGGSGDLDAPDPGAPPQETNFADDAGPSKKAAYRGDPLCRVTADTCSPDDDGYGRTAGTKECAEPVDAGADAEPSNDPTPGCRLALGGSGVTPVCAEATRGGGDGVSCSSGADCAPGFDCVDGDKGATCRRYCCMGTCEGHLSQNGGATFCDVQKLLDTGAKAPVCMPLKPCTLLKAGECADTETCAVVTESGATGCVPIGPAQVGDSCDVQHCAVGLTCLGQPGNRRCYQLCKVGGGACGLNRTCMTSTIFDDPAYGVCQP